MVLSDIHRLLACQVFWGEDHLDREVIYAGAADLMSDVLAFTRTGALLLTGLVNVQTVQTAHIAEMCAVVFVRGKKPDQAMVRFAREKRIPLLGTTYSMFEACGILFQSGIPPTMNSIKSNESA
jgi:predicted transcriptional regulator